jgi:hypothetical protein
MPKNKLLPHHGVFTRLRSSKIHRGGIGVFAICDIKKGAPIFGDDSDEIVWIKKSKISHLPTAIKKIYDDFAIIRNAENEYGCPKNFNLLTLAWYLNESSKPNVKCGKDYRFFASRNIKAGEELTVDYSKYSDLPKS